MIIALQEHLIELGGQGLLTITTEPAGRHGPPLPAERHAYARWQDADGHIHDRLQACTRPVAEADYRQILHQARTAASTASPAFQARLDWLEHQLGPHPRQCPQHVGNLGGGRVVLLFWGAIQPHLVRVVDVVTGAVLSEETADDLVQRCRMRIPEFLRDSGLVLYASGSGFALVAVYADFRLFHLSGHRLEPAPLSMGEVAGEDAAFSAFHLLLRHRETAQVRIVPLDGKADGRAFKPRHGRKGYAGVAAAEAADRFVTADENGVVEVMDGSGTTRAALRLTPLVHQSQFHLSMSPDGRYVFAHAWEHGWVIDTDRQTQALVDTHLPIREAREHTMTFVPGVDYLPATRMLDVGLATVHRGVLNLIPPSALDWQPALPAKAARRGPPPAYKALLENWRRSALALRPTRAKRAARSHLYGLADLPPGVAAPTHEQRPMLLLCQLDLAEIAGVAPGIGLPERGLLAFFIAEDASTRVLDDNFNPLATAVRWLADAEGTAPSPNPRARPAQALRLARDRAEYPGADAAIVQAQGLAEAEVAEYQAFLDNRFPNGLAPGHRLGGYPTRLQQADPALLAAVQADDGRPPQGWRLLLQLDSDDAFMWGTDSGMLYFLIHEDDLARADFSQVQAFCEGY